MSHEAHSHTRVLHPFPTRRIWPVTGVMPVLEAHQTQAAPPGGCCAPDPIVGTVQPCGGRPEDVDDRRTLREHAGRVWPEHSGNPWRLSSGGSWRRSAAIRNRCDVSSPLPLKGGGTSEGLCDVVVVDHNRHHTLMRRPGPLGGLGVEGFERCTCHAALTPATDIKGVPSPRPRPP